MSKTTSVVYSSSSQVVAALRLKYPAPEYALFCEVADSTGGPASRSIDVLVQSLWPSRGLDLVACEIKVSRSDWLRERKNPEKAEMIAQYCDRFYVVVGTAGIVKPEELPPNWGLMQPRGNSLVIAKEAVKLEPLPMSRRFLAAILRRAAESGRSGIAEEIRQAKSEAVKEYKAKQERAVVVKTGHLGVSRVTTIEAQHEELKRVIERFENASGVSINQWHGATKIGQAVKLVLSGQLQQEKYTIDMMERFGDGIKSLVTEYRNALTSLKQESTTP